MKILVPRFYCENNYRKKKEGENKQYTLTILPGFLIPYSRIPVELVHKAVEEYITNSRVNETGAALLMNCLSSISFRKYLRRVKERIDSWILLLFTIIDSLNPKEMEMEIKGGIRSKGIKESWRKFIILSAEYTYLYGQIPKAEIITKGYRYQYIYCLLSRNGMGLGP